MAVVFIGIGSNLGDRLKNIDAAIENLGSLSDLKIIAVSSFKETIPQQAPGPNYLNGVVKIDTSLGPQELLVSLQQIEKFLGRKRRFKNAPRPIDLDILLYDQRKVSSPELTIPHLRMLERDFVLNSLLEIEPNFKEIFKNAGNR